MTLLAIAIGLTGVAMSVVVRASWRRRINVRELGTMSEHWLAEHQANARPSSER